MLRKAVAVCVTTLAGTLWPAGSGAYNETGHLESVRLVVELSLAQAASGDQHSVRALSPNDRQLVEFCAQLPDLVQELDATKTYKTAFGNPMAFVAWGVFNSPMNDAYRRMVAVQQLLHGLTGGKAAPLRAVAISALSTLYWSAATKDPRDSDRLKELCALGFAFHLYGDTFAHTQMAWSEGDAPHADTLYPTGRGHGFDSHYPDDVLCNWLSKGLNGDTSCNEGSAGTRIGRWLDYWSKLGTALLDPAHPRTSIDSLAVQPVYVDPRNMLRHRIEGSLAAVLSKRLDPNADDGAVGEQIRTILNDNSILLTAANPTYAGVRKAVSDAAGISLFDDYPACEQVLRAASEDHWPGITCAAVWTTYSSTVLAKLRDCISPKSDQSMPECERQSPVDSSWRSWILDGRLAQYAGRVLH